MIKVINLQDPKDVTFYSSNIGLVEAIVSHTIWINKQTSNLLDESLRSKYRETIKLGTSNITGNSFAYSDHYYSKIDN